MARLAIDEIRDTLIKIGEFEPIKAGGEKLQKVDLETKSKELEKLDDTFEHQIKFRRTTFWFLIALHFILLILAISLIVYFRNDANFLTIIASGSLPSALLFLVLRSMKESWEDLTTMEISQALIQGLNSEEQKVEALKTILYHNLEKSRKIQRR